MPTLLMLNDTANHDNWGSQACAEGLKRILAEALPGVEMRSLLSTWVARHYLWDPSFAGRRLFGGSNPLWRRCSPPFQVLPRVADEFDSVAETWAAGRGGKGTREFLDAARGADAVVYNAEGSAYRTNLTAVKCLFMTWYARTRLGIPGFFLNGSVTLADVDPILPAMMRKEFAVFDGVTVREPWSLRNCQKYIPGVPVELTPDSVFHFRQSDATSGVTPVDLVPGLRPDAPYFCFSLSMLPMDFVRTREKSSVVSAIRMLKALVPQAVLMAKDAEDQFLKGVADETGSLFFGPSRTFREVMALLGGARFLFTGRYHHVIMATIMGCPSVPMITTSHKMNGLCELLALPDYDPLDPTDLWTEMPRLEARVKAILAGGDPLRARVQAAADRLRPGVARMGTMVAARIGRGMGGGPS